MIGPPAWGGHTPLSLAWHGAAWVLPRSPPSLTRCSSVGEGRRERASVLRGRSLSFLNRPLRKGSRLSIVTSPLASSSADSEDNRSFDESNPRGNESNAQREGDEARDTPDPTSQEEPIFSAQAGDLASGGTRGEASSITNREPIQELAEDKRPTDEEGAEEIDWDASWADARRKMEKKAADAPAFSGRKKIIPSRNEDGSYDFVEVSQDGRRLRREANGVVRSEGFGFIDGPGIGKTGSDLQGPELDSVNRATTNAVSVAFFT